MPHPILVKFMRYMRVTCLRNVKILCSLVHKEQICRQKTAMRHFPPNYRSPLAPKLRSNTKSQGGPKNGTDTLYPHAKFGGDLPPYGGEREKQELIGR